MQVKTNQIQNIYNLKIYKEIFETFIDNTGQNSFHAFTAVEVCNVIASALIILRGGGDVELKEIIKYDLQGKILGLRRELEKTDNLDKDNVILLLNIIRSVPMSYFSEVFDFIKNKINNKGINLEKKR